MKPWIIVLASSNAHKIAEITQAFTQKWNNAFCLKAMSDYPNGKHLEIIEDGSNFYENALIKAKKTYHALANDFDERVLGTLSDDSGLCVEVLNGEPGIFSARYGDIHGEICGKISEKNYDKNAQIKNNVAKNGVSIGENTQIKNNVAKNGVAIDKNAINRKTLIKKLENTQEFKHHQQKNRHEHSEIFLTKAHFTTTMVFYSARDISKEAIVTANGELHGNVSNFEKGKLGFGYDSLFYPTQEKRTLAQMSLAEKNSMSHRTKALEMMLKNLDDFFARLSVI